jgi:DNA-binding GntR family transcriptional regulator
MPSTPRSYLERSRVPSSPTRPEPAATQRVQDEIRRDIILGALPAGTRITEAWLAAKYEVSRVPVREALRALEAEGFVESKPYAGSTVSAIPVEDAEDLFTVREALEAATARRAAKRAAAQLSAGAPEPAWWASRKEIAAILDEGDAAIEADRPDLLPELNIRFHLAVAELSGSVSLAALLRQIAGKIEWLYASDVHSRGKSSWQEHRAIMAAIDAGDLSAAETRMGAHVRRSRTGYMSRFST